jgi:hypothetical protein
VRKLASRAGLFANVSKECFWSIFFLISCKGSQVPFWQFFTFGKTALLLRQILFRKIHASIGSEKIIYILETKTTKCYDATKNQNSAFGLKLDNLSYSSSYALTYKGVTTVFFLGSDKSNVVGIICPTVKAFMTSSLLQIAFKD